MTRKQTRKQKAAEMIMPPDEHHADPRTAARFADQNARVAFLRDVKTEIARLDKKLAAADDEKEKALLRAQHLAYEERIVETLKAITEFEREES